MINPHKANQFNNLEPFINSPDDKHRIRLTSLIAHEKGEEDGAFVSCREKVLRFIRDNPDSTDLEISKRIGLSINNVTGRRNKLLNDGLIVESGVKPNIGSNKQAITWRIR